MITEIELTQHVKAELQIKINYSFTCQEFYKYRVGHIRRKDVATL